MPRSAINQDTLTRALDLLDNAEKAARQELAAKPVDVNRARAEVQQRKRERIDLAVRLGAVSARLTQLVQLQPTVNLRPAEPTVVPIALVPDGLPLDDLVATGLMTRPELAQSRAPGGRFPGRLAAVPNQSPVAAAECGPQRGHVRRRQ